MPVFEAMINALATRVQDPPRYSRVGGNGIFDTVRIDDTQDSWSYWKNILKNRAESKRPAAMFYFGHGSDVSLGPAPGAHVGVYTDEIQAFLINGVTTGTTNFFTPFSFVFLYGCDTAKSDWPLAFGIEKRKVATSEYTARGIPPRAFVGWTSEKRAGIGWHFIKAHSDFVIIMFERWSSGLLLKPAIDYAISQTQSFQAPDIFGDENLKWDWTQ